MPEPPIPAWQQALAAKRAAAQTDEPKDMFELAEEDPENFGSTQLAETYGEETDHKESASAKKKA
jgi:hypothetical protein